jgi:hypothetical protein
VRSDDPRLTRLRALIGKLERLPASTQRERALTEVRARIVDVETGEVPRAMRPVDEPAAGSRATPPPPADDPAKPERTPVTARRERAQALRRPAAEPVPPATPMMAEPSVRTEDESQPGFGGDGLLWLEDEAGDDTGQDGGTPWRRGLRG